MSLDTPENPRPQTPSGIQIPATITKTPTTVRRGRVPPTPDSIESEHDSDNITGKITKQKCFKTKSTTNNSLHIKNSSNSIPNNNFTNQDQPSSSYSSSTSNLSSSKQLVLQQQQLGQSDRMSKEKQKFFRHSAFNSGRVLKTSPPTSRNKLNNNRSSSSIQNSLNTSQFQYNSSDSETKIIPKFVNLSATLKKEAEKNKNNLQKSNLSDTTSSSSSSDESSSSGSCSSSDDDSNESDSSSSSNSSSSSTTTTNDNKAINALKTDSKKIGFTGNIFKNNKSKLNVSANNTSFVVENSKEDTWGFAAEAKKPSDIFSKNDIKTQQRIFGNFSGVEKDSLIKVDGRRNSISDDDSSDKNDRTSNSGPLKGLFDSLTPFFTTNDYTRRSNELGSKKDDDELPKEILKETRSTFKTYKKSLLQEKLKKETKKTDSNKILIVKNFENKSEAKKMNNCVASIQANPTTIETAATTTKIAQNPPPVIKKRIIPVSLPLDRSKMRYNSSSDDEIPYLSPSKLFKQACNSKKLDEGTSSIFKTVDHKLFGSNDTNNLDFASLRENGNTTTTTNSYGQTETVSPYNNNQSMGKKHVIKINGILFRLFFFFAKDTNLICKIPYHNFIFFFNLN